MKDDRRIKEEERQKPAPAGWQCLRREQTLFFPALWKEKEARGHEETICLSVNEGHVVFSPCIVCVRVWQRRAKRPPTSGTAREDEASDISSQGDVFQIKTSLCECVQTLHDHINAAGTAAFIWIFLHWFIYFCSMVSLVNLNWSTPQVCDSETQRAGLSVF